MPSSRLVRPAGRVLRALASVGVTAVLLWAMVGRLDVGRTWQLLVGARPTWLALAVCLAPAQMLLGGWRWAAISRALGQPMSAAHATREVAMSTLLNQLLPGGVSGDAIRVWRRREVGLLPALSAAAVDRWLGLWVHLAFTCVGLGLWWLGGTQVSAAVVMVCAVLWIALSSLPAIPVQLGRDARRALPQMLPPLVLSVVLTGSFLGGFGLCALALGRPLGVELMFVIPVVLLSMAIPLSIGGWGLREASAVALLPAFGWSPEQALALSTLYGLSSLLGALPGALVPALGGAQ